MKLSRKILLGLGLGIVLCFIYGYRLGFPPEPYYDEVYHVPSARQILRLEDYKNISHPPLGRLLIALGIKVFGDRPWAWRIFPLSAGLGIIVVIFLITQKITGSRAAAFFASSLMSLNCLSLTQARIAMLNAPMMLFLLLSIFCFLQYAVSKSWPRENAFFSSGLFFGLALATKLVSLMTAGVLILLWLKVFQDEEDQRQRKEIIKDTLLFWIAMPAAIYFTSYGFLLFMEGKSLLDIWRAQVGMIRFHTGLRATHIYSSPWWSWPLMTRPIWYYFKRVNGDVYGILSIGNPAIFWLIPLAMGYSIWRWITKRHLSAAIAVTGFFCLWLPYALGRRVKFFHYFDMAMPFVAIAFGLLLESLWKRAGAWKMAVIIYYAVVTLSFIYWYPLLTGFPISENYFRHHMWFRSWV